MNSNNNSNKILKILKVMAYIVEGHPGQKYKLITLNFFVTRTRAFLQSRTGKKVVSLVGWLAKSKIAKRVAETDFAKKAYERAYKKFQRMPIVLKVEIQSVKGNLAVNIPPPPTNRIW